MKIVFAKSIIKNEFGKIISDIDLEVILRSCNKGLMTEIKGYKLPHSSKLVKMYSTTVMGARRIVFLVDVESDDLFFLFYRDKNDKVGKNISIKNEEFKLQLSKYLISLNKDINSGDFEVYELK